MEWKMENLTQRWTLSGLFPKKISVFFFSISEVGSGGLPLHPGCAPVSVPEYASISLNIPKYPLKCLNKLFYVWALNMPDHLACSTGF